MDYHRRFYGIRFEGPGHVVIKLLTFGKYPRAGRDEGRTVAVGFLSCVVVFVCLAMIA